MQPGWLSAVIRLIGIALFAALASACASSVAPPLPVPGPVARLPPIGESAISVHASASYPALAEAADAKVPAVFYDLPSVDLGYGLTFHLTGKRADILVSRNLDRIEVSSAVHVDGSLDSRCVVLTHCAGTLTVDGRVWGSAKPTVNPDWTLNLAPEGQFFLNDADLNAPLFPGAVSVKGPLSVVLKRPFDDLIAHMNDKAAKSKALKTAAAAAWAELSRPIAISISPPVWLVVNPTRILTEQPTLTDQGVELGTALVARPELFIGDMPPAGDPGPLPDLTLVDKVPEQFSLYLPVRLTWDDATELAEQNLAGKRLQAGGGVTVSIDHVSIFNNGDQVGVKLAFHAATGGWKPGGVVYLVGKPVYNLNDGYIAIENLHFDIQTQNTILKLASWLAHQALVDDLQARLHLDVKARVQARRQDLARAINNTQLGPRVTLQGEVSTLAPSAVYLTRDALQVNVVALGTLKVIAN